VNRVRSSGSWSWVARGCSRLSTSERSQGLVGAAGRAAATMSAGRRQRRWRTVAGPELAWLPAVHAVRNEGVRGSSPPSSTQVRAAFP
jgi:hypothetical protein